MAINTAGWSDFKKKLHATIFQNELSSISEKAYSLSYAGGESGYSFGYNQMDVANNPNARTILDDILANARDSANHLIVSSAQRTGIKGNWQAKSSAAFSANEKQLVDRALSSAYGKIKIEAAYSEELDEMISHIGTVINSVADSTDKQFLQNSVASRLFLADYHNQFDLSTSGPMSKYLKGQSVTSESRSVQKEGSLDWYDLMVFYANLKQCKENPTGQKRRAKEAVKNSGLSNADQQKYCQDVDDAFAGRRPTATPEPSNDNFSFPALLNNSRKVDSATITAYYNHIEKTFPGGYFPVGANTVWHGGVHIKTCSDSSGFTTPVRAITQGKIVGVRLASTVDAAVGKFGSHNFLITEHMHGDKKFYSLYMHLAPLSYDSDLAALKDIPWLLKDGEEKLVVNTEHDPLNMWAQSAENTHIKGQEIFKIPKGTAVQKVSAPSPASPGWVYVTTNGHTGYVKESFLKRSVTKVVNEELVRRVTSGSICALDIAVTPGMILWRSGKCDVDQSCNILNPKLGDENNMVHWEIFSETHLFAAPEFNVVVKSNDETKIWQPGEPWGVRGVKANRTTIGDGVKVTVAVTLVSHKNVPESELSKIKWEKREAGKASVILDTKGKSIEFNFTSGTTPRTITLHPYNSKALNSCCATLKYTAQPDKAWQSIEDRGDDYLIESGKIRDFFKDELANDGELKRSELEAFYKRSPKAVNIRNYACRFVSEWGITNLEAALNKVIDRPGNFLPPVVDDHKKYVWWKEAVDAGVHIPGSPLVWHYNPVRFLEEVSGVGKEENNIPVPDNSNNSKWHPLLDNMMLCLYSQGGAKKPWHGSFGKDIRDETSNHTGSDLLAAPGTNVYAPVKCKIKTVKTSTTLAGKTLILEVIDTETFKQQRNSTFVAKYSEKGELKQGSSFNHNGPFYIVFFHLNKNDLHHVGDIVNAGTIIAKSGTTGANGVNFTTKNPHLHVEINNLPGGTGLDTKCNPSVYFKIKTETELTTADLALQERLKNA